MRPLNEPTSLQPVKRLVLAVRILAIVLLVPALAFAGELSEAQRQQIIRDFLAERPWAHRIFPSGKAGLRIEGGKITPSDAEVKQLVAQFGVAAKPGDRVKITGVRFIHHAIEFEINGGSLKRKSWIDRISLGVNGLDPGAQQGDGGIYNGSNGSSIQLVLGGDTSKLNTGRIKELLAPVLDFTALSRSEAYLKSLPPVVAAAIKHHHALVGMDKDMVIDTVGLPSQRLRDSDHGQDYEEWIYGTPPQDVEFIRFVGNKVIRIEDMKVSGEKVVRTKDEVGAANETLHASAQPKPAAMASPVGEEQQRSAPTLLRPGEKANTPEDATRDPNPAPPPVDSGGMPSPGQGGATGPNGSSPY